MENVIQSMVNGMSAAAWVLGFVLVTGGTALALSLFGWTFACFKEVVRAYGEADAGGDAAGESGENFAAVRGDHRRREAKRERREVGNQSDVYGKAADAAAADQVARARGEGWMI